MTISTSDNTPRISYSVSEGASQSSFAVPFEFFADADLNVYLDGTLKTISTHYSVSGGSGTTGSISMSVTGASGGSTVIITRGIALDRTTDFPTSGSFAIGTLNTELDRFVAIQADLNDTITRSVRLQDDDAAVSMELPLKADRLGKALTFNSSTGAVQVQTYASPTATAGIDGVTAGTVAASKFVQVDSNKDISSFRNLTASGTITAGTFVLGTASLNENDLESIDGITAGTVAASKAAIVDSSKNITGFNNVTLTGELDAATLDISGDANIAGEVQTTKIAFTDGDDAMTITNTGLVEFNTGFNVGSDAAGDILYNNGTKYVRLAKGNDGQALVLSSGLPAWGVTAGDIAGVTAGTGLSGGGSSGSVTLNIDTATTVDKTTSQTLTNKTLTAPAITDPTLTVDNLASISTIANDDVFLAIDTSGGGLKKVERSVITAGLASSTAISNIVEDTSPQLGGNLDVVTHSIITDASNRDINFQAHGTGVVVIKGNTDNSGTNAAAIKLNCSANSHGQTLKAQPHSAGITNTMLLPIGSDSTLVSLISADTLTNKTLTAPTITDPVITSLLNTSLVVGRDADNQIQFGTDNFITFRVDGSTRLNLISSTLSPSGTMDLGSNSSKFQNIFLSGEVDAATLDLSSNADIAGNLTFSGSTAKINLVDNNATALSVKEGSNNYMVFDTADSGGEQITLHKKLDLNGVELILDADADTSIHASTDDQIDIKIAGADDFSFTANTFTAASGSTIAAQALTATSIGVDNITIDGNTISSTDTNGNINLTPNGTGKVYITNNSTQSTLIIESTIDGTETAPDIDLYKNSDSPADGDYIGNILWNAQNTDGTTLTKHLYFQMLARSMDVTAGTEDGAMEMWSHSAGTAYERFTINPQEVVVNESSIISDFRVESNGDANCLFVAGGSNRVGIGTNFPTQLLDVDGNLNVNGTVTKPNHPAFLIAKGGANQQNLPVQSTTTVTWTGTEYFDQDSNFASNTFTAPVTGKYQLNYHIRMQSMDTAASYYTFTLTTSNRNYINIISPNRFNGDPTYWPFPFAILADMDANDTATITFYQWAGAAQTDISYASWFSGYLVA